MDDNKELVEVMLTSYNKYADKIGAPHGYIACMEAALSIIQPELDKRDEALREIAHEAVDYVGAANYSERVAKAHDMIDNALKTTTDCPASLSPTGDAQTAAMNQHGTSEDAQNGGVKTTTGHDTGGGV